MSDSLIRDVPTWLLFQSPTNPRKTMDPEALQDLAASIRDNGLISPITVRPVKEDVITALRDGTLDLFLETSRAIGTVRYDDFEVVAGNRRYAACHFLELPDVPCIIRELTDEQVLSIQIDENLHREDVPPLEEAEGFRFLMEKTRMSVGELAGRLNKSASYVHRRLRLNNLIPEYVDLLQRRIMNVSQAEMLAIWNHDDQKNTLKMFVMNTGTDQVRLESVQYMRRWMKENLQTELSRAPFPLDQADITPGVCACHECPFNSATSASLFPQEDETARCGNKPCFAGKKMAWKMFKMLEYKTLCDSEGREAIYYSQMWQLDAKEIRSMRKLMGFDFKVYNSNSVSKSEKGVPGAIQVFLIDSYYGVGTNNDRLFTELWVTIDKERHAGSVLTEEEQVEYDLKMQAGRERHLEHKLQSSAARYQAQVVGQRVRGRLKELGDAAGPDGVFIPGPAEWRFMFVEMLNGDYSARRTFLRGTLDLYRTFIPPITGKAILSRLQTDDATITEESEPYQKAVAKHLKEMYAGTPDEIVQRFSNREETEIMMHMAETMPLNQVIYTFRALFVLDADLNNPTRPFIEAFYREMGEDPAAPLTDADMETLRAQLWPKIAAGDFDWEIRRNNYYLPTDEADDEAGDDDDWDGRDDDLEDEIEEVVLYEEEVTEPEQEPDGNVEPREEVQERRRGRRLDRIKADAAPVEEGQD